MSLGRVGRLHPGLGGRLGLQHPVHRLVRHLVGRRPNDVPVEREGDLARLPRGGRHVPVGVRGRRSENVLAGVDPVVTPSRHHRLVQVPLRPGDLSSLGQLGAVGPEHPRGPVPGEWICPEPHAVLAVGTRGHLRSWRTDHVHAVLGAQEHVQHHVAHREPPGRQVNAVAGGIRPAVSIHTPGVAVHIPGKGPDGDVGEEVLGQHLRPAWDVADRHRHTRPTTGRRLGVPRGLVLDTPGNQPDARDHGRNDGCDDTNADVMLMSHDGAAAHRAIPRQPGIRIRPRRQSLLPGPNRHPADEGPTHGKCARSPQNKQQRSTK